jgi:magnesium and cobalt exporter, CNNM family
VRWLPNGDLLVRGHVAIGDLADYGIELPDDNDAYTSIGGLVFHLLGRLPRRGDAVTVDGHVIRVESVRENRVESLRIRRHTVPAGPTEGGDAPVSGAPEDGGGSVQG